VLKQHVMKTRRKSFTYS